MQSAITQDDADVPLPKPEGSPGDHHTLRRNINAFLAANIMILIVWLFQGIRWQANVDNQMQRQQQQTELLQQTVSKLADTLSTVNVDGTVGNNRQGAEISRSIDELKATTSSHTNEIGAIKTFGTDIAWIKLTLADVVSELRGMRYTHVSDNNTRDNNNNRR